MKLYEIPLLAASADQTLSVTIENVPISMRVLWNERFGYWSLSIAFSDGEPVLTNVKMVNNWPLTKRYQRLPFVGDFYFVSKSGKTTRPTYDDVGNDYGLFYYDPEDVIDLPLPIKPRGSTQTVWDSGNTIWIDGSVITDWI